jgi:hypothetical protein
VLRDPHVKEPNVTAQYEHYAHDEWSIGDIMSILLINEMFTLGSLTRSFTSHPKNEFTGPDFTRIYAT